MSWKKIFISFFLFLFLYKNSTSQEIYNLASINNQSITNYDLYKEIKIREQIEGIKITKNEHSYILQKLIEEKIKKIELEKYNILIDENEINQRVKKILSNTKDNKQISEDVQKYIYEKFKISLKWNKLINIKYFKQLEVNTNEIDEIIKSKNLKENMREKIIISEKSKKLNILSKSFYDKVKRQYLVKTLR